jgi:transcriptional regulator with XRE-family HTH domain
MSIAKNVKRLRLEKKISPDFIAKKVGKGGRQWVYDLEKGKIQRITDDDIEKLAEVLGVKVDDLREKNGQKVQESFEFYLPKIEHDLNSLKGFREKYYYIIEENRRLWKENAYLKSLLLKHQIDVYNADTQNDTV